MSRRKSLSAMLASRDPGLGWSVLFAVLVHIAILVALTISVRWSIIRTPPVIQAKVVEEPRTGAAEREAARKRAEAEALRRQQEDERRQTAESEKQRKIEAERERKAQEEQRRAAEAKKQAAAKRKQEEESRLKAEADRKRKAEDEKRRVADAKRKEDAAKRRQQEAERHLKEQIAAEETARVDAARAARAASEMDRYRAIIRQKVERSWSRPGGASAGMQCVVRVRVVPGGEVLSAKVVKSSGNALFDRSVENAVFKASPLPLPSDAEIFEYFREIEFVFSPQE